MSNRHRLNEDRKLGWLWNLVHPRQIPARSLIQPSESVFADTENSVNTPMTTVPMVESALAKSVPMDAVVWDSVLPVEADEVGQEFRNALAVQAIDVVSWYEAALAKLISVIRSWELGVNVQDQNITLASLISENGRKKVEKDLRRFDERSGK